MPFTSMPFGDIFAGATCAGPSRPAFLCPATALAHAAFGVGATGKQTLTASGLNFFHSVARRAKEMEH
jgi:hypothetical protein